MADSLAAPRDYAKPTPGGRFVLVMRHPGPTDHRSDLRRYPKSGLYRNDRSARPLWTVAWFAAEESVVLSSDGRHMVIAGRFLPLDDYEDISVLGFYRDGRLLKEYRVGDLVQGELPRSVSHRWWQDSASLLDGESRLVVTTSGAPKVTYTFDITTGRIIAKDVPGTSLLVWCLVAFAMVTLIAAITAALTRTRTPLSQADG
jgi:hypothetical protein